MAKTAKKTQTDYTRGGKAISDTAIPLYQENLTRMGSYLENPQESVDSYLNKYFSGTAEESDFLRNYQRAMAGQTGSNYAATSGGYSSLGQSNYADQQRYWNDLANRLYSGNVTNAYNMAGQDFANMLNANTSYNQAYGLGKDYSDIEQWNYMAKQANSPMSQIGSNMGAIGAGVGAIFGGPLGALAGSAIGKGLGGTFTVDSGLNTNADKANMSNVTYGAQESARNSAAIAQQSEQLKEALSSLFNKNKTSGGAAQSWASGANLQNAGNYRLNTTQPTGGYKFSWQQ